MITPNTRLALVLLFAATSLPAQQFLAESNLVLIPVTVTDRRGANIRGLVKERFTVLADHRAQPISAFYIDDAPCTVGIVMDISGSLQLGLRWEKSAIRAFMEAANPEDDYFVVTVSSSPRLLSGSSPQAIIDEAMQAPARGWTALYDAIGVAARHTGNSRRFCRTLLVISDGMDNHSSTTKNELLHNLMEGDVQVYTLGIEAGTTPRKAIEALEAQRGLVFLDNLAEKTGGLSVRARQSESPAAVACWLSSAMRSRYVLGFHASDTLGSGKWHRVEIKIDVSGGRVYARSGYRSPTRLP